MQTRNEDDKKIKVTAKEYLAMESADSLENKTIKEIHRIVYEEWDAEANGFPADEVKAGSELLAHWKCRFGHKFQEKVRDRFFNNKHYCAECISSGLDQFRIRERNQRIADALNVYFGTRESISESPWKTLEEKDESRKNNISRNHPRTIRKIS